MLWTIVAALVILWHLGFVTAIEGGFIHTYKVDKPFNVEKDD